jgi:hypothetical protein
MRGRSLGDAGAPKLRRRQLRSQLDRTMHFTYIQDYGIYCTLVVDHLQYYLAVAYHEYRIR